MHESLERTILQLVDDYVAADDSPEDLRLLAKRHAALPVTLDVGGALLLRHDGEILEHAWDSPSPLEVSKDAVLRRAAVVAAADKYPQLSALVPDRPAGAADCLQCGGTGKLVTAVGSFRCGQCGGFGWL